jgi:putative methyltransferase (TIGR04325 family)
VKSLLKHALPERTRRWLRQALRWRWFHGDYATWAEARAVSAGYDDGAVLARVLHATREVRAGRALWDRDGVTFQEPEFNVPLLAVLRAIAAGEGQRLELVDFGGALGGTWWQHRSALADLAGVRWRVVEQPHFVTAAQEFANPVLSFHESLAAAGQDGPATAILFSSVLPYVEFPHALLAEADRRGFRHILIDRTPLAVDGRERLVVQRTPPELGGGSYPSWCFRRETLLAALERNYVLRTEWPGFDQVDPSVEYRGFHFARIDSASPA